MTKIEALLEIIRQARDNQKLVEAIEALLVGEESVRDSAGKDPDPGEGEKDAALKQQAPAEEVKAEAAPKPKKRNGGVAGSQSWTQDESRPCGQAVGR